MKNDEPELRKNTKKTGTLSKLEHELHGEDEQRELAARKDAIKEDSETFLQYVLRNWKVLITGMITVGIIALSGFIWLYTYIFGAIQDIKNDILNTKRELVHYIDNSVALVAKK